MPVSVVLVSRKEGDGRVRSSLAALCAALRLGVRDLRYAKVYNSPFLKIPL